jgi:SAM-dependent methyltransferase
VAGDASVPVSDPLAPVAEVCERHGVKCSAAEFHAAVNVAFHHFESQEYDDLHRDMWRSLPAQINLLAEDCLRAGVPENVRVLDIGCGTGLAIDGLLKSPLAPRIESVDLLDTSATMLARAQVRRQGWGKPGDAIEGLVESLAGRKRYHLILTSSVLHHVPDLASFLRAVAALQDGMAGAFFVHLQDPNADYLQDPILLQRSVEFSSKEKTPEWLARLHPRRVAGRLWREIRGQQGRDYISKTNERLIQQGFIRSPLSVPEIFAITDIHAQEGAGISIERMKALLPDYALLSRRSYGFYGSLWSELPAALREIEEGAIRDGDLNGFHASAVWRRRVG